MQNIVKISKIFRDVRYKVAKNTIIPSTISGSFSHHYDIETGTLILKRKTT